MDGQQMRRIAIPELVLDVQRVKGYSPAKYGKPDTKMQLEESGRAPLVPTDPEMLALILGSADAQRRRFGDGPENNLFIGHWVDRGLHKCRTLEHVQDLCHWYLAEWETERAKRRHRGD